MLDRRANAGFTLIELIVVMVLVAVMATVAIPSFNRLIETNRQSAVTNDLIGLLKYARAEAVRRGQAVGIKAAEFDAYLVSDAAQTIRIFPHALAVTRLDGGAELQFRGSGLSNVSGGAARFRVCVEEGADGAVITVNRGGQVSTEPNPANCPT